MTNTKGADHTMIRTNRHDFAGIYYGSCDLAELSSHRMPSW